MLVEVGRRTKDRRKRKRGAWDRRRRTENGSHRLRGSCTLTERRAKIVGGTWHGRGWSQRQGFSDGSGGIERVHIHVLFGLCLTPFFLWSAWSTMSTSIRSIVVRKGDAATRFTKFRIYRAGSQSAGRVECRVNALLAHPVQHVLLKLATDLIS